MSPRAGVEDGVLWSIKLVRPTSGMARYLEKCLTYEETPVKELIAL
jgi:hypothetical protein